MLLYERKILSNDDLLQSVICFDNIIDSTMHHIIKIINNDCNLQQLGQVSRLRNLNRSNRTMQPRQTLGHDLRLAQLNYLVF